MSESVTLPNFEAYGYHIQSQLGENLLGGRYTFLADRVNRQGADNATTSPDPVVIKQFRFAQTAADWSGFRAHEAEVNILQQLHHPGIPRYLDAFETPDGFCLVQEYKPATSLETSRQWPPEAVKQVAIALLEILTYLQSRPVPVIHRDIKPANILVDDALNVYLVDFGFARLGGENLAASSMVKGTMGFMPPEQLFNRDLTTASDLYSLGATLICLVTGTRPADIGTLIMPDYRIRFRELVPPLHRSWLNWLERLVEPRPENRYRSAQAALAELRTLDIHRVPKVKIDRSHVLSKAAFPGEVLEQTVELVNSIPDTCLTGRWEFVPHESDPPHAPDTHPWIQISPAFFEGNRVRCQIRIQTAPLALNQHFLRSLRLCSNGIQPTETLRVEVQTAALPPRLPYGLLLISGLLGLGLGLCVPLIGHWLAIVVVSILGISLLAGLDLALTWSALDSPHQLWETMLHFLVVRAAWGALLGAAVSGTIAIGLSQITPENLPEFLSIQTLIVICLVAGPLLGWVTAMSLWTGRQKRPDHLIITRANRQQSQANGGGYLLAAIAVFCLVVLLATPDSSLIFLMNSRDYFGSTLGQFFVIFGGALLPLVILGFLIGCRIQAWLQDQPSGNRFASVPLLMMGWSAALGVWLGLWVQIDPSAPTHDRLLPSWVMGIVGMAPLNCIGVGIALRLYNNWRVRRREQQQQHIRIQS